MTQPHSDVPFTLIAIAYLGAIVWPVIISSLYLLFRWRAIKGKVVFWLFSILVGYALMDGIPYAAIQLIKRYVGMSYIDNVLAKPNHTWLVMHYWSILGAIAFTLFLLPIISTHVTFRRFSPAGTRRVQ